MARYFHNQNSFQSGVLSPRLYGRTDVEEYRKALSLCQNMDLQPTGGMTKRKGLKRYSAVEYDEKAKVIHIPLVDEANLSLDRTFTIYYGANPNIFLDGVEVERVISNTFANFALEFDGVTLYDIVDHLVTPAILDPYGFSYVQLGAYLIITHSSGTMEPVVLAPTTAPSFIGTSTYSISRFFTDYTLSRAGHTQLESNPFFTPLATRDPVDQLNQTATTLSFSSVALGSSTTVTASSAYFTSDMIGEMIMVDQKNNLYDVPAVTARIIYVRIEATAGTPISPSTTATGIVELVTPDLSAGTASDFWKVSAFSSIRGWPRCVATHESRLIFASTFYEPNKFWASSVRAQGNFNSHALAVSGISVNVFRDIPTPIDTSIPYSFQLASEAAESISWITSSTFLAVGTNLREIVLDGGDSSISAANFPQVIVVGNVGSSAVQPLVVKGEVFSVSRRGDNIINMKNSDNGIIVQTVSRICDFFSLNNEVIVNLESVNSMNMVYVLCLSGNIYSFTLAEVDKHIGFTQVILNEKLTANGIYAVQARRGVLPYLVVSYTNDVDNRDYIGGIESSETPKVFDMTSNAHFLDDFGLVSNNVPGFPYDLNGLLADTTYTVIDEEGVVFEETSSAIGRIILPTVYPPASIFLVGLKYKARMETLPLEVGPNFLYSSRGDAFRIDTAHLQLFNTYDLMYGSISDGEEIIYPLEIANSRPFSGNIKVNIPMTSSNDTRIVVESESPFTVTVSSLLLRGTNTQVS